MKEPSGVSVVVPVYGVTGAVLDRCLSSLQGAVGPADSIQVVIDGPETRRAIGPIVNDIATSVNPARLGLVGNWNHCLGRADRDLVHLMHADDAVLPGFYTATVDALRRWPEATFAMAGADGVTPELLVPERAARLLLGMSRPPAGSTVLRRRAWRPGEPYSSAFPYCPDEELLPRLASLGPVALVPRSLYVEHQSRNQARHQTWLEPDFVDIYWGARMMGVSAFPADIQAFARSETGRILVTVIAMLVRTGHSDAARTHIRHLRALDAPVLRTRRFRAAWMLANVPGAAVALRARDRVKARRSLPEGW